MRVKIVEVAPRDGLQNEKESLDFKDKAHFIKLLVEAGHKDIEVGAFVNPEKIPQMASSGQVIGELQGIKRVNFWALVPNLKGYESATKSRVSQIAIFTAASETFNQKNINTSINGSFERFKEFVPHAKKNKIKIRGYVSTCFGCPYEGKVNPKAVLKVTERLLDMGVHEISIGDTIGVATPYQVRDLTKMLLKIMGPKKLALHFHDTRGTALANIVMGLESGLSIFDSSSGGLGGCPYAPGAAGNVSTEDLLYMLQGMGVRTGIDLNKQVAASLFIQEKLGHELSSRYLKSKY